MEKESKIDISKTTIRGDMAFRRPPNYYKEPQNLHTNYGRRDLISISRSLYTNEGIVRGAIHLLATHALTNAFIYKARHDKADIYNEYINNWAKVACTNGDNFINLLYQISTGIDVDGDCFVLLTHSKSGFPQLQLIRANRIYYPFEEVKKEDSKKFAGYPCYDGIVVDSNSGREIAYCLDGEKFIDSSSIVHCKDVDFLSSFRGTPLFAHSLRNWRYYEEINESELNAQKIASQIAIVETNESGDSTEDTSDMYKSRPTINDNETSIRDYGNGTIKYFQAGTGSSIDTLKFERPAPNYLNFTKQLILSSLAGVGIPYSIVIQSDSNSVASRVDMSKFDKEVFSRHTLLSEIAKKCVEYVIAVSIERGELPAVKQWYNMTFSRCPKASLNWSRDITADINLYEHGLKTLTEFADERGLTLEEFLNEKSKDYEAVRNFCEKKNIPFAHFGIVETK